AAVALGRGDQAVAGRLGVARFQAVDRAIGPQQTVAVVLLDVVVRVFLLAVVMHVLGESRDQVRGKFGQVAHRGQVIGVRQAGRVLEMGVVQALARGLFV